MLHSNTRQMVRTPKQQRNKKDTTYMQILLLLLLLLPFFLLLMSCWHLALPTSSVSACPFPPADTHTAHSKNTGAGENEPTTSQVPSYDVRTRTHLAGGRRPAYFIHARDDERTSFTAAEARPARRGTGSRRQRKAPPPRAPAATSQRRAPTTELRGCLRARHCLQWPPARAQLPSGITP